MVWCGVVWCGVVWCTCDCVCVLVCGVGCELGGGGGHNIGTRVARFMLMLVYGYACVVCLNMCWWPCRQNAPRQRNTDTAESLNHEQALGHNTASDPALRNERAPTPPPPPTTQHIRPRPPCTPTVGSVALACAAARARWYVVTPQRHIPRCHYVNNLAHTYTWH